MNGFLLVVPIFMVRYVLLGAVNKDSLRRAAFSPRVAENERMVSVIYQITNAGMLLYLLALKIRVDSGWFYPGLGVYGLGIVLYAASTVSYGKPHPSGINRNGLYRVSRNPMYVAYFVCILGCGLLAHSWVVLALLVIYQVSVHWIILSEERWCLKAFGDEYRQYMKEVRRYF